jgi:hypothetical protein
VETWTTRELPVLRALVEMLEDPARWMVRIDELPGATGLSMTEVQQTLRALSTARPAYITAGGAEQDTWPSIVSEVSERARRAVGQWPASDNAADVLIAALERAADSEPDEERKSGLRKTAGFLASTGKEVLIRVMTQVGSQEASQHIPHHL